MADKPTNLERSLTFCVDARRRRIYWGDVEDGDEGNEFAWDSVEMVIRAIHYLEAQNKQPIELHMSSPGGCSYEMLRLHDVIQACACQVKFIGGGTIMSAATWIMACCDERHLYPNTRIMLHKWSGESSGTDIDHRIDLEMGKELTNTLNTIFENNSRMPAEFWNEITHRDLHITAEEAIMLGIADKVIAPRKRGNLRRSRIAIMNQPVDSADMRKLVKKLSKRVHLPKALRIEIEVPKEECDPNVIVEKEMCDSEAKLKDQDRHIDELASSLQHPPLTPDSKP